MNFLDNINKALLVFNSFDSKNAQPIKVEKQTVKPKSKIKQRGFSFTPR